MKAFPTALLLGAILCGPAAANPKSADPMQVPAGTYVLDKKHASLVVKIPHLGGFSRYTFRFDALDGGFAYDPASWRTAKASIQIDAESVDTGNPAFNKEIAGFLDADKYPQIVFVSQSVTPAEGGSAKLLGELTLHGVTKPVILDVAFNGVGPGLLGAGTRLGFSGVGRVKRSDFGVTSVEKYAGDDVDLLFEVEFVKK